MTDFFCVFCRLEAISRKSEDLILKAGEDPANVTGLRTAFFLFHGDSLCANHFYSSIKQKPEEIRGTDK